ncbi:hypothetical protein HKBW3S42_02228 [Candidatus Hakubella thermalkaliphila]|uniref:Uncharacterized protein n=1 Tax=Candidatus Hakubella thermalkaliphila TaxID=2754717 RepID=A0A6V8PMV4_9ACTN|nr:hypothetical protein HKBW3S42_02228 [Candidatus Hakubella thermalkaliphila]
MLPSIVAQDEKLIGIEVIDASEVIGGKIEFELPEVIHASTMRVCLVGWLVGWVYWLISTSL